MIADCDTLKGDLIIGEDMTTFECPVKSIKGSFIAEGAIRLASINMPNLEEIDGNFTLKGMTELRILTCPKLVHVGSITWNTLPALIGFTFNDKISEAKDVLITDTQLTSIDGIDLETVGQFTLGSNRYLKKVEMARLKSVGDILSFEFNAPTMEISMPQLEWSNQITVLGARAINMPLLMHVNRSMNIGNNTIKSMECKNLTEVEQTLAFIGNSELTEVDFPKLKVIGGGFKIHNNTKYQNISGFPKLETVRGAIDFVGKME